MNPVKLFIALISAVMIISFFTGCVSSPAVTVKAGGENRDISVKKGENFLIRLEAQLSTGYSWKLAELPPQIKIVNEDVKTPGNDIAGGMDIQEFTFKASGSGEVTLLFRYGEHWKEKPKFSGTSKVKVTIR